MTDPKGTDSRGLAARCDALEETVAHHEQTIEELSTTITRQWQEIEALKRTLARLGERIDDVESASGPGGVPIDKPPHY